MKPYTPTPTRIPFTRDGYQKILDEKSKLETERPDAVLQLSDARSMGDLSENGYYKAARARLSRIDGRLRHLEKLIRLGKVMEKQINDSVGFGSTVVISDDAGTLEYTIVGGHESDPKQKTISHISPLGKALLHRKPGDTVHVQTPAGTKTYRIQSVR